MRNSLFPQKLPAKPHSVHCMAVAPARRSLIQPRVASVVLLALATTLASASAVPAVNPADEAKPPSLEITAVSVSPEHPAPDTLCRLSVDISNPGTEPASQLAFEVRVAGHELPIYRNQIFMQALPPGKTTRVDLYNFWTTETARPAPKGDEFTVEVTLREAQWYRIGEVVEEGQTLEEWTPLTPVPGLPRARAIALPWKSENPSPKSRQ